MNEPKTLKNLIRFNAGLSDKGILYYNELKAEAVKWIEEDRGLRKDNTIWRLNGDELLDLLEDRWMKRFNIIGKDLE